jgi:MoxR-like ATPase
MATATAKVPARRRKKTVTPDDLRRVARDINENVVIERGVVVREILLTALSGTNLHLLGVPGVAKSLALRAFAQRIVGGNYFEIPFNEEIGTDEFYGPPDIPRLTREGVLVRNPEYHAPWAHVIFGDEMFRSNGVMQNALLPIWNVGERHVKLNGHLERAPMLFGVSASNTLPDPDDRMADALMARITTMLVVERLTTEGFKQMLGVLERSRLSEGVAERETITLAQLQAAQDDVALVRQTPAWVDAYAEMRAAAIAAGLDVDDRRLADLEAKQRANAWLGGREELIVEDIVVVRDGLWRDPEERNAAHEVVKPYFGRFERSANDLRAEIDEPLHVGFKEGEKQIRPFDTVRPLMDALPPNQDDHDLMRECLFIGRRLWATRKRVQDTVREAEGEGADTAALRELEDELAGVAAWYDNAGLPSKLGPTV